MDVFIAPRNAGEQSELLQRAVKAIARYQGNNVGERAAAAIADGSPARAEILYLVEFTYGYAPEEILAAAGV